MPLSSLWGETRPAWKVLRVLANLLNIPGFDYESTLDVLKKILGATKFWRNSRRAIRCVKAFCGPIYPGVSSSKLRSSNKPSCRCCCSTRVRIEAMARRIVWYVNEGDEVTQGEEFGFIKFGSRVDVFVPMDTEVKVELGQKVKGGETVICQLKVS